LSFFGIITPSIFLSPREPREVAMRFRKTLTFLFLSMALLFALPAGAQPKIVEPTLRAYPEFAEGSARADVAASLPRHGGVKPPLRYAAFQDGATMPGGTNPGIAGSPAKPFTQEQVVSMVRAGLEPGTERSADLQVGTC
jgi:hypothetical protein